MEAFRSRNPSGKPKKKCRRHPNIDAAAGKDLCVNCLAADNLATQTTGARRPEAKRTKTLYGGK